ncbi:hypothetical protein APY04_0023 [Hyphomicrobium sulfonivorans]|uniref:Uncharacterized protein n=1 Tax=Hyphomicrobium sulfonivorans TaxID=121290 RepID=A0A120CYR8_HYPSL|nr:hypothetical protein APY04_0023 [Hyphomicrobium sulfonivorans]
MLWLAAGSFGDEGKKTRDQLRGSLGEAWQLGIESCAPGSFSACYESWVSGAA